MLRKVTIKMGEELLARAQTHAREHGMTFDQMVSDLLSKEIRPARGARTQAMFALADRTGLRSFGGVLTREEAHERV